MIRLTDLAHDAVRAMLQLGDIAIDATAGNGHDTGFLLQCVGPAGRIFAFDIQPEALEKTAAAVGNATNVVLFEVDHANMREAIPTEYHGRIGAVMFNLGYLPGGKKTMRTRPSSTIPAVSASLELLRPGGVLAVVAYTGHRGGEEETDAVGALLNQLSRDKYEVQESLCDSDSAFPPRLFVVHKWLVVG